MSKLFKKLPEEVQQAARILYILDEETNKLVLTEKLPMIFELPKSKCYVEFIIPFKDKSSKLGILIRNGDPNKFLVVLVMDEGNHIFQVSASKPIKFFQVTGKPIDFEDEDTNLVEAFRSVIEGVFKLFYLLNNRETIEKTTIPKDRIRYYCGGQKEYVVTKLNPMFKLKYNNKKLPYVYKGIVKEHEVQKHTRTYTRTGKTIEVKPYTRGNPALGRVKREFLVTTE